MKKKEKIKKSLVVLLALIMVFGNFANAFAYGEYAKPAHKGGSGSASFLNNGGEYSRWDLEDGSTFESLSKMDTQYAYRPIWVAGKTTVDDSGLSQLNENGAYDSKMIEYFKGDKEAPNKHYLVRSDVTNYLGVKNARWYDKKLNAGRGGYRNVDIGYTFRASSPIPKWTQQNMGQLMFMVQKKAVFPDLRILGVKDKKVEVRYFEAGTMKRSGGSWDGDDLTVSSNVTFSDIDMKQGIDIANIVKVNSVNKKIVQKTYLDRNTKQSYSFEKNKYTFTCKEETGDMAWVHNPIGAFGATYTSNALDLTFFNEFIPDYKGKKWFHGVAHFGLYSKNFAPTLKKNTPVNKFVGDTDGITLDGYGDESQAYNPREMIVDGKKENTVPSRLNAWRYAITAHTLPYSPVNEYKHLTLTDTIESCLEFYGDFGVAADGKDVSEKFDITVDGNTITAKCLDLSESSNLYNKDIVLWFKVRPRAEVTTETLMQHGHYSADKTYLTFKNKGKVIVDDHDVINTNETKTHVLLPQPKIRKYAEKFEYKTNPYDGRDRVKYTIKVNQTKDRAIGSDLIISDRLPNDIKLDPASIKVTSVSNGVTDKPVVKDYMKFDIQTFEALNGFTIKTPQQTCNDIITITYEGIVTAESNGKVHQNNAHLSMWGVDSPTDVYDRVWNNTPILKVTKQADKEVYELDDVINYTIKVESTVDGTIAHDIDISDEIKTKGVELVKGSVEVLDKNGHKLNHNTNDLKPDITYKDNGFFINTHYDIAQGKNPFDLTIPNYNNKENATPDTFENNNDNYVYSGVDTVPQKEKEFSEEFDAIKANNNVYTGTPDLTPEEKAKEDVIYVTYQAKIVDENLQGQKIENVAVAHTKDNEPFYPEDKEEVTVKGPHLTVEKTVNDVNQEVGKNAKYEVVVMQDREDSVAKNVKISDHFKIDGMEIDKDTIKLYHNTDIFTPVSVTINGRDMVIETGKDLAYGDKITLTYEALVKDPALVGRDIENVVTATSDNSNEAEDNAFIRPIGKDTPVVPNPPVPNPPTPNPPQPPVPQPPYKGSLALTKTVAESVVKVGDTLHYKVLLRNNSTEDALNVIFKDTFMVNGVDYLKDTVRINVNGYSYLPFGVMVDTNARTMQVITGQNLKAGQYMELTYEARVVDQNLSGKTIPNVVVATTDNHQPLKDNANVKVDEERANLMISKDVNKEKVNVGDRVQYIIKLTNNSLGEAKNVVIRDIFDKTGMEYDLTSVQLFKGAIKISPLSVGLDNAGALLVKTGTNLAANEQLVLIYEARVVDKNLEGQTINNVVVGTSDNTPSVEDNQNVLVGKEETPSTPNVPNTSNPPAKPLPNAQTGDYTPLLIFALVAAGAGALLYLINKKKK